MVERLIATIKPSEKRSYLKMHLSIIVLSFVTIPKPHEFLNAHTQFYSVLCIAYIKFPLNINNLKNDKNLMWTLNHNIVNIYITHLVRNSILFYNEI